MSYVGNTPDQQAFTPAVDFFNGNGSTTAFTLSRPVASVAQVQAVISNVPQKPGDAYTVSGNTITFTSAPPSGTQNIYVYYTSPITQVIAPGQGTVGTAQIQNGAVIPADLSTGAPSWDTSGNVTTTGTVNSITVGRGAGAVSTNTAVGASALASGSQTGTKNTAVGQNTLNANTSGSNNIALGTDSLPFNTTGGANTSAGVGAMYTNTTGSNNTAFGFNALVFNTTASNNTAVGYQAGYTNTTGTENTYFGYRAGYTPTSSFNTFFGSQAGRDTTTGASNTFVGAGSGYQVTTGSKNTILGNFNGNNGGLDIRTSSNFIVLSDGDGNPRLVYNGSNNWWEGNALQSKKTLGSSANLNNEKVPGFYRVDVGAANTPTANYYALVVFGNGDNVTTQIATELATTITYVRSFNSSWTSWARLDT